MTLGLGITLGAILGLLLASAFFSGSETALTAASAAKMHALEEGGSRRARVVNYLLTIRERFIGAILLGNTLANVAASALATSLFLTLFGEEGVVYATIVMTVIVVLFAEVLPKTYAILNADRMALAVAPVVRFVVAVLAPVTATMQWIVRHTLRLFGVSISDDAEVLSAHEEIRGAIELHHKEGGVVKLTRDMLGGVLDLRELTVSDIMVHRTKMDAIDAELPTEQIVDARPEKLAYASAAMARRARGDHRRPARQDTAPGVARLQGRPRPNSTSWRSRCRPGSFRTPRR